VGGVEFCFFKGGCSWGGGFVLKEKGGGGGG